jgi:hypothetical protein
MGLMMMAMGALIVAMGIVITKNVCTCLDLKENVQVENVWQNE